MNLEKAVNNCVHSEHGEKQELMHVGAITQWVIPTKSQGLKVFAVPAAFAVVE